LFRPTLRSALIRDRNGRYVVFTSSLVFVACLIAGLRLDPRSMFVNLLAGLGCVALGVPIAIWVVDRYIQNATHARWARVDEMTHRAIATHLCDAMVQLLIDTPALKDFRPMPLIQEGRDKPDARTIEGLSALTAMLRDVPNPGSNDLSDAAIEYYEISKWDLDQLCDNLLTRVIEYSDEHDVIDSLAELDSVRRALHTSIIGHKLAVTGGVFENLPTLVDACGKVYALLLNHWHPTENGTTQAYSDAAK